MIRLPHGLAPKAFNNTTKSFKYTPVFRMNFVRTGPVIRLDCMNASLSSKVFKMQS